jgi:hypothetical protein
MKHSLVAGLPWKDHFKSDFRSDQDHLLEKGFQIRSRSYLKKMILILVKISKRTKQFICRCRTQKRTVVAIVMKHKQHNDPQYANCCSATRARKKKKKKLSDLFENDLRS